ncbi:proline-rich domain-containing protein [Gardnerella sp. Marseille-Q9691]|uniref:proline-rich domain-containing protein n=1 Tax=Gardnerella sp. Marseille-Q9691 TaxID=3390096 RepID=UPI003970AA84
MDVNNNSDAVNNQNNSENSNSYNAENSSQSAQSYVNQQSDVYNQPQYDQAQYQQDQYQQDQYQQSQYQQDQYQKNQYQPTQPQYAQSQQTYAQQPQYSQAQYGQPQYGQQQYAQPQYAQPQPQYGSQYGSPQYGSPQGYAQMQNGNPQCYAQSQYGGNHYGGNQYGGNQYGGPQYGMPGMPQYGAPRGYAQSSLYNRFNEHEKLVNTFCSQWNEKEIGLVIILSIAVAIGAYLILDHPIQTFGYGYSLSTAWLYFAYNLIPFSVVLGFAQVARKNNFVIIPSIVWFIVQTIYYIWNHNYFDIMHFILYLIATLVFIILLEVFQRQFVVRKRSNIGGSILGVLISTFAYVIIMLIFDIISGSSISYFYLEHFAYTFITLSILPIILAAILRAFGLAKFLNPKREEMNM